MRKDARLFPCTHVLVPVESGNKASVQSVVSPNFHKGWGLSALHSFLDIWCFSRHVHVWTLHLAGSVIQCVLNVTMRLKSWQIRGCYITYMYVDSLCMTYVMPYTLYSSVHIQTQGGGCFPIPSSYRTCARAVPHCDPPVPIHNSTVCYYTGGTLNLISCTFTV